MVLVLAASAAAAGAAAAAARVSASPALFPRFQRSVTDYVSRCGKGRPLRLSLDASPGSTIAVGAHPARSGRFSEGVSRRAGEAVSLRVRSGARTSTHHIRCLPTDFPHWVAHRRRRPQAQWFVTTPIGGATDGYVAIFDSHGVPVWWRHSSSYAPIDAKLLPDGNVIWAHYLGTGFGIVDSQVYEEHGLDGRLARIVRAVGNPTDTHDMEPMPNGHSLVMAYRLRRHVDLRAYGGPEDALVWDAEIQELTPDGKLVWSWNSKDHVDLSETGRWWPSLIASQETAPPDQRAYDLIHINSVEPDGNGFVVSARYLDAVFRIDRKTGAIDWKLGGTHRPESLTVAGDPLGDTPFAGQHDARLFEDGTVTVYDNGNGPKRDRAPRVVRYRIDTQARTGTLLERLRRADVDKSQFGGSARKLPGGNWVICWGGTPLVTEQTPSGKTVLSLRFRHGLGSYRAVPVPRGQVTAGSLRRGMDRMNRG
jgi:arylsulfotransferase ASST